MDSSTIAIVITVITIVSFILEKIPLAMTAMIASLAMGILVPEMKLSDIYSGFASNNVTWWPACALWAMHFSKRAWRIRSARPSAKAPSPKTSAPSSSPW